MDQINILEIFDKIRKGLTNRTEKASAKIYIENFKQLNNIQSIKVYKTVSK